MFMLQRSMNIERMIGPDRIDILNRTERRADDSVRRFSIGDLKS